MKCFVLSWPASCRLLFCSSAFNSTSALPRPTATPEMQSWFTGDDAVNHHIWHPVGTLSNGATYATAKAAEASNQGNSSLRIGRLPASH